LGRVYAGQNGAVSDFHVNPASLDGFADVLTGGDPDLAAAATSDATGYAGSYIKAIGGRSTLADYVSGATTALSGHLQSTYPEIGSLLSASGRALHHSARFYRTTDESTAATMDAQRPGGTHIAFSHSPTRTHVSNPRAAIRSTPSDDPIVPDAVHQVLGLSGWSSIGNDILEIASVFGFDPVEKLTAHVFIDGGAVAQAGHAAEALAAFDRTVADDLQIGLGRMAADWRGHASGAATTYFTRLANAVYDHAGDLDDVATKFMGISEMISSICDILGGLLATVIDKLIICAGALASAGCLQAIPAVDVIADIIGAYEVYQTYSAWTKFADALGNVINIVDGFTAAVEGIIGFTTSDDVLVKLPPKPYAGV